MLSKLDLVFTFSSLEIEIVIFGAQLGKSNHLLLKIEYILRGTKTYTR